MLCGPNSLPAENLSPAERLGEVAELLAAGLMRLRARKSSPLFADRGESLLDCLTVASGDPAMLSQEVGE
jgi:hypothetical protein